MFKKLSVNLPTQQRCHFDKFPNSFDNTRIHSFTAELIRDGQYPQNFITKPQVTAQMLSVFFEPIQFPAIYNDIVSQIVAQTNVSSESFLHLLLEHSVYKKFSSLVIQKMLPSGQCIEDVILLEAKKCRYEMSDHTEYLLALYIVQQAIQNKSDVVHSFTNIADIRPSLVYAVLREASSETDFEALMQKILELFYHSIEQVESAFYNAVSRMIEEEIKH